MDAISVAFKLSDGINFYWHFYVPSVVALVGWVFARREPWPWTKRALISLAFIGFMVVNVQALIRSYVALGIVVKNLDAATSSLQTEIRTAVTDRLSRPFWEWVIVFHLAIDVVVLYFVGIWSGKRINA